MLKYFLKKIFLVLAMSAIAHVSFAAIYWEGDSTSDPTDWNDATNWRFGTPAPGEHAIIHDYGATQLAMPIIRSDVGTLAIVTPSWHNVVSSLMIEEGGKLVCSSFFGLGYSTPGGVGHLYMNGGVLFPGTLYVGNDGRGEVHLDGGRIHANVLHFGGKTIGTGSGNLDITKGLLLVNGDITASIADWEETGYISGYGGTGSVLYNYDPVSTWTEITATTVNLRKAGNASFDEPTSTLSWSSGRYAVLHDVYIGSGYDSVNSATTSDVSGIYRGRHGANGYTDVSLQSGQVYYWRIDEVVSAGTVTKGDVWTLRVALSERDIESDTWVAIDGTDRILSGYDECGGARSGRHVGMYYMASHTGGDGPYDITQLLAANPSNPAFAPEYTKHHWGEPELGYYLSDDEYVIRKHAQMLTDAGVDTLILIWDGHHWAMSKETLVLLDVFQKIRNEGGSTPQVLCMAHTSNESVITALYDEIYAPGLYQDLWFYWEGKPLILGPPDDLDPAITNFFTFRDSWFDIDNNPAWPFTSHQNHWQWGDSSPQDYGWDTSSSRPEQVPVCVANHPIHTNIGRSNDGDYPGTQPSLNQYDLPVTGTEKDGIFFQQQWECALDLDPEFMLICGWNEWTAMRFITTIDEQINNFHFVGRKLYAGDSYFVDLYNEEYNRDAEPVNSPNSDNYYYQVVDGIRRYKGVRPLPVPSSPKMIAVDGIFSEWADVAPEYRDTVGDTFHRNHEGWGSAGPYINTTGRNDLLDMKVARDTAYIFFYAKTSEPLTAYTDPSWMLLFINADQNHATGWQGYDYVINRSPGSGLTTLEQTSSGWNWSTVSSQIEYAVNGNEIEIRVPRSLIGQGGGFDPVALDFHWADNIQADNDILEFALSGDSAPNRRFNYRYQTQDPDGTVLLADGFESGVANDYWGDWDITAAEAYSGSHSLERSKNDSAGTDPIVPTAGLDAFRVSFKYKLQNTSNFWVYYHDNDGFVWVAQLGTGQEGVWLQYTDVRYNTGDDVRFFNDSFMFHLQGSASAGNDEFIWVDDVEIIGYSSNELPPPTYAESYAMWTSIFGLDTNGTGAMTFDAEYGGIGDGLDNLAEYTLGGDPTIDDAAAFVPVFEIVDAGGGSNSMQYVYNRRLDAAILGLTYGLNQTMNLQSNWNYVGTTYETGSAEIDLYFESVTNTVPATTDEGFISLGIQGDF